MTSRPTICRTSSSTFVSAIGVVAMYAPSRMTVTVSQRSKTSSNRCEMKRSARPSSRRLRATANSRSTSTPRQRGGRLVHDEHASVERDRLRDLDDLLVGDREALGRAVGVDAHAEPGKRRLHLAAHRLAVDPAEAVRGLAAHEDVLRDRQVGEERGLLVDDGDARLLRLGGRGEVDVLAVEAELARVAAVEPGDDLHERGLARAVLADEGVDRAGIEREAAGAEGDDGAERLGDPATARARGCGAAGVAVTCRSSSLR